MKRIGWRGESYRHSLASRGISTGSHRYMGAKMDMVKHALLPHKSDEENVFQEVRIGELRQMTHDRIAKEEAAGNLTPDKAEEMIEILDSEISMLKQGVSYQEVKHELARKLDAHVRHNSKKGLMPWSEEHKKDASVDEHKHPGVMPYNNIR